MGRRKPEIHVDVTFGEVTDPDVVERWRQATEILLRALQRRDGAMKKVDQCEEEQHKA